MRLKATPLSCAFAWAPSSLGNPTFLAAASLAGAVDDDFSGSSFLEIYLVDVTRTDETNMPLVGRTPISERALRVDWCPYGGACGIIAVACVNGAVYVYDSQVIMKNYQQNPEINTEVPLLSTIAEHTGAVRGCQFNPSQPSFLAIGADDGEWDVWTLENPRDPKRVPVMSNSGHTAAIVHLQWHPKYPHIIATAAANGIVNVWNLKLQTLAVSLNVSKGGKSGVSANAVTWHPVVPTQIAVALDEKDPAIQIWDLKKSMVPLSEMRGHEGGITGLAWNPEDASMIASCGADGRTIWWDPATGERSGALQQGNGYITDVRWSPLLPAVLATSSFEPLFCVATAEDTSTVASAGTTVPKWLKKPCGASINLNGHVAALVPGSKSTIGLSHVCAKSVMSPSTSQVFAMHASLEGLPKGSSERVEWLKSQDYHLFAAAAACKDDRVPILEYLNEESTVSHEDSEDPFETMQASKKSVEDVAAAHIAAGRIHEAVEACLDDGLFDDAFAIAYLQGGKLLERVHREYTHHAMKLPGKRHVRYAAAVSSGDIDSLTADENISWKEALSVIISFVGEGFSAACDKLGVGLKKAGNLEGALTCFVCSGNVNAVVDLWREENRPVRKMMRDALVLEEVTGRRVTAHFFADFLYDYGMRLVGDGVITEAMPILQRSAAIGNRSAAILVDRMKFDVPVGQVAFPFPMTPLTESPSPACVAFFSQQQQKINPRPEQGHGQPMGLHQHQHQHHQHQHQHQQHQHHQHQHQHHQHQHHHHNAPPIPQPQQHQKQQHQNFYTQQQPPPVQGMANSVATSPQHTPYSISSYSSMGQGPYVSSGPPPHTAAPGGYNNGFSAAPAHNPPPMEGLGSVPAPPQQNYVDPNRLSQPFPTGSHPPPTGTLQPPPGPPQPVRAQQSRPYEIGSNTAPLHSGAPALPSQVSSSFNAQPMSKSVSSSQLFPGAQPTSSESGNMAQSIMNPKYLQGNQQSSLPPPQQHHHQQQQQTGPGAVVPSQRMTMPGLSNSNIDVPLKQESSPPSLQANSSGMGNIPSQSTLPPPPPKSIPEQNSMSKPNAVQPPPSPYPAPSNDQGPYSPPSQSGTKFSSTLVSHVQPSMSFGSAAFNDDSGLLSFNIASLSPGHQALAQKLCGVIQQMNNLQRRSAVSKAALELFKMLQRDALLPEVVGLIFNYVNAVGTPTAKNAWRQLSDQHFEVIQPFMNLKFL